MNEKLKNVGRVIALSALVAGAGYECKELNQEITQREQAIDQRCGGPERPNCERIVTKQAVPHFDGTVGVTTIVEFLEKRR